MKIGCHLSVLKNRRLQKKIDTDGTGGEILIMFISIFPGYRIITYKSYCNSVNKRVQALFEIQLFLCSWQSKNNKEIVAF